MTTPAITAPNTLSELSGTYAIDPAHTRIGFVARHAMVTKVRGAFNDFEGSATVDSLDLTRSRANLTIKAASIDTRNSQRDEHLRGPNFFQADRHPSIGLRALRFEPTDDGWIVPAVLSVGGAETPVTLHARRLPDPAPGTIAVLITGEFDRTTTRIRAPRLMVGHRIAMEAELRFTRR